MALESACWAESHDYVPRKGDPKARHPAYECRHCGRITQYPPEQEGQEVA